MPTTTWVGVVKVYYTQDSGDSSKRVRDLAGNQLASIASASAITMQNVGVPTGLALATADDTGVLNNDGITKNTNNLTITGCATANSTVTLYKDGVVFSPLRTGTANGAVCTNGTDTVGKVFSIDVYLAAQAAAYSITATATNGGQTSAASDAVMVTVDTTVPTVTYTVATGGGASDGTDTFLNVGDTVSVSMAFSEMISDAPVVQYINNTANLGSAVTAVRGDVVAVALADSSGDSASTTDAIDFGVPTGTLEREAVGNGYVYKTLAAHDSLYIAVSGDAATGVALKGRTHSSAPTSSTVNTAGTELFSVGSRGSAATVYGGTRLTNVAAGTYFWFYPSALRTMTNREMTVITDISADKVTELFKRNTLCG